MVARFLELRETCLYALGRLRVYAVRAKMLRPIGMKTMSKTGKF
jgi:hypothetical protein